MMSISCRNPVRVFICSVLLVCSSLALGSGAVDRITQGQVLRDGETLVSRKTIFSLGFFSPPNSMSRYLGIWHYQSSDAIVWVANRASPVSGRDGVLTIGSNGSLMVLDGDKNLVWSNNATADSDSFVAILNDTGNLMLLKGKDIESAGKGDSKPYWQSFDDPTDTYLLGMKVPTEQALFVCSWKSPSDPSPGNYSMGIDTRASPQVVILQRSKRYWRSGYWNQIKFTGIPNMTALYSYGFKLYDESYFSFSTQNSSIVLRFRLRWDGKDEQLQWDEGNRRWDVIRSFPSGRCDFYNRCGNFGSCDVNGSAHCSCLHGFKPRNTEEWNNGNFSGGCVRRTKLECANDGNNVAENNTDRFLGIADLKLPDFAELVESAKVKKACEAECMKNCSCNAYAFVEGIGCMLWGGDLIDIEHFANEGNTVYVRLADSELGGKSKLSGGIIAAIVFGGAIFVIVSVYLFLKFRGNFKACSSSSKRNTLIRASRDRETSQEFSGSSNILGEGNNENGQDLPLFNFSYIDIATNYFSFANRLGEGGFGPVYKGKLPGGEEIAVKRLSKMSGQGMEELKNEIVLIAKLQHRNLVRVLGCCIEGEEKMLIYEYMPNKSLDFFLFDPTKRALLDWKKRALIIEGIASGLLYLHRDSRLRIIHRDLKASNILLDKEMNPKISDFGLARIFGGTQSEAKTTRVVGTYGYMSPEYAMEGLFSVKSDVYSFGILLLEIVSGQRNGGFRLQDHPGLVESAWQLWSEGRATEFIDTSLDGLYSENEVIRCIHIGMLCIQDSPSSRPTMSSVLLMLGSEAATLPTPKQPTFTSIRSMVDVNSLVDGPNVVSSNDITLTTILGR